MITLCVFPTLKVRTGSGSGVGEGGATDGAFDQTGKPVLTGGGIPVFCWSSSGIHKLDALVIAQPLADIGTTILAIWALRLIFKDLLLKEEMTE